MVLIYRDIYGMEPRAGLFVRAMLEGKGFFCPLLYDKPYPDYPFLYFLISWPICKIVKGVCTLCLALPSLVSSVLLIISTFLFSRRFIGEKTAYVASLIVGSIPQFWLMAEKATIDMMLAFFSFCANLFLFKGYFEKKEGLSIYVWLGWLFIALSYFVKGPIGIVITVGPMTIFLLIKRRLQSLKVFLASSFILICLILLVHFIGIYIQGGDKLVRNVIDAQLFSRLGGPANKPFYYYFIFLFTAYSPWLLFLSIRALLSIRSINFSNGFQTIYADFKWYMASNEFIQFMAINTFVAIAPFIVASSRHGRYLLPAFAPISIIMAPLITKWMSHCDERHINLLKKGILFFVVFLSLLFFVIFILDPARSKLSLQVFAFYITLSVIIFFIFFFQKQTTLSLLSSFAVSVLIATSGISLLVEPGISFKESGREFVIHTENSKNVQGVFLVGIRPDGDGLKYSLFSRYYPERLYFLKYESPICQIPSNSIVVLYEKKFKLLRERNRCLEKFPIISRGYIHGKETVALYFGF